MATKSPHVLIIGAGLGGLTLAQALRKKNISFEIFERDTTETVRSAGWCIALHWITQDLIDSTPDDLPSFETVSCTANLGVASEWAAFRASDASEVWRVKSTPKQHCIRVNRAKFRHLLMSNVKINWGKNIISYEEDQDGVTAHFKDGTTARGDILVGADGISGHVRGQLLKGSLHNPTPIRVSLVLGEVKIPKEQYERHFKQFAPSFYVGLGDRDRILVAIKDIDEDLQHANYYWMVTWNDDLAEHGRHWTESASKQEMHDYALEKIKAYAPNLSEIIRATPVDGITYPPLIIRDMIPQDLPRGRVTLIGDAAHPMSPFRGEGGNHALKDALELARAIVGPYQEIHEKLKRYERTMIPRGAEAVLASRDAAELGL